MTAKITSPEFNDETAAREWLERERWPQGAVCPHCGTTGERITKVETKKRPRPGLYVCNECHKQFTVTVGTLYERSHIPLHKWLLATHLMTASKKGISTHQLHRMLGITYKSAWFMSHRIREGLRPIRPTEPLGGQNKVVEIDETYIGGKAKNRKHHVPPKEAVFALVERDGRVYSEHVPAVTAKTLRPILNAQIDKRSYIMTDEAPLYWTLNKDFSGHGSVNHSIEEYVRGGFWHTNTVENYFSIVKRSIYGVHHFVSPTHLKRYLGERDFMYNERANLGVDDAARMKKAIAGIGGKRLTYRRTNGRQANP